MIVAARVCLLFLVALAAVAAFMFSGRRGASITSTPGALYACPMHPEITGTSPGDCPICGMALAIRAPRREDLMPDREGVGTAANFLSYDVAPVHRRVLSAAPDPLAWLDDKGGVFALLYEDEMRALANDQQGSFFAASAPGAGFDVRRAIDPPLRWQESIWRVRFRFETAAPPLLKGATGWITLVSGEPRESLVVLSSAVLRSPEGAYLLALSPDRRRFSARPVVLGKVVSGFTVVIAGADARDLVVGSNAFSLDAERRLGAQRQAAMELAP